MKRAACLLSAVLCLSFLAVTTATAQVPYHQDPVERVLLLRYSAHFDGFMADLKKNIVPLWDPRGPRGSSPTIRRFFTKPPLVPKTGTSAFG